MDLAHKWLGLGECHCAAEEDLNTIEDPTWCGDGIFEEVPDSGPCYPDEWAEDQSPVEPQHRRFTCESDQLLRGVPIQDSIPLYHIVAEDHVETVQFSLFVNGFSFVSESGKETSLSLQPICLIRCCRFTGRLASYKSFKIYYFGRGQCFYFAIRSEQTTFEDAEQVRSRLVLSISHAIYLLTLSLYPAFSIRCLPLPDNPQTHLRLLAGYLIHQDQPSCISVLYCELQAHWDGRAYLAFYENELCTEKVMKMPITQDSSYVEILGINCSCFSIGNHHFSARTQSERKLWLRGISNVQVKLRTRAPNPTQNQLAAFRASVKEHIHRVECTSDFQISSEPLLQGFEDDALDVVDDSYILKDIPFEPYTPLGSDDAAGQKAQPNHIWYVDPAQETNGHGQSPNRKFASI